MEISQWHELVASGLPRRHIERMIRSGDLVAVRQGAYGRPQSGSDDYLAKIDATVGRLGGEPVLGHASAAHLWGLPVPRSEQDRVHVVRDGESVGYRSEWLHIHRSTAATEPEHKAGYSVTSLARTSIDLVRDLDINQSLAVLDAALRLGASVQELEHEVDLLHGTRGIGKARWALPHADGRSESPGESLSRYLMIANGLPLPELQFVVVDANGVQVARTDFAWPELGIVGEFDGAVKYAADNPSGLDPVEVLLLEKARELRIRGCGLWVIRWGWKELMQPCAFAAWLRAELARAHMNGTPLPQIA